MLQPHPVILRMRICVKDGNFSIRLISYMSPFFQSEVFAAVHFAAGVLVVLRLSL